MGRLSPPGRPSTTLSISRWSRSPMPTWSVLLRTQRYGSQRTPIDTTSFLPDLSCTGKTICRHFTGAGDPTMIVGAKIIEGSSFGGATLSGFDGLGGSTFSTAMTVEDGCVKMRDRTIETVRTAQRESRTLTQ